MMKLLLTGAYKYTEQQFEELRSRGHEVHYIQDERIPLKEQELSIPVEEIEGVICNGLFCYNDIKDFQKLRYIQLTSAGFDRVPMDYVKEHGIEIHNARGVYSIPMAEYAIGGVLWLYKQAAFFYENQKKHCWEKHRGVCELFGKTVCIVGCGSIGTECAKRFKAFGCSVIGIATSAREQEHFDIVYSLDMLNETLAKSDVVVLAIPLSEETRYLIGVKQLALLKKDAIIVNIARGAVMDSKALETVLASGQLGGAVLDVFEAEPLDADSPLWDMKNVIITPHNSFVGENNKQRLEEVIFKYL